MADSGIQAPFSLFNTQAMLMDNGVARALDSGSAPPETRGEAAGGGWTVLVQHVAESWGEWERQRQGGAFLFLLWGAAEALVSDDPAGGAVAAHALKAGSAFIVPAGAWCRVMVDEPANLFMAIRANDVERMAAQ